MNFVYVVELFSYINFSPSFSLLRRACGIESLKLFLLKFLVKEKKISYIGESEHMEYWDQKYQKTYMINNDFMLARNSGIAPVKLLFDKSLKFRYFGDQNLLNNSFIFVGKMIILTTFPDGLDFEFQSL